MRSASTGTDDGFFAHEQDARIAKEAGPQSAVRVVHRGLNHEIARGLAHRRAEEFQRAREALRRETPPW
jgi:hypothetical protein